MAGRVDPSRDLRLGLHAFESGAITREDLIAALGDWAGSTDRGLAEVLAGRGSVDAATIARLESRVADDLASLRREATPTTDVAETVDHVGGKAGADVAQREGSRFRTLRPHARGGLGEVFLAFDRELNRTVALKELQARLADDPGSRARFLLEAEITGRLEHPGIVPVYSLGHHPDGRPYYAMHLIRGETLQQAIGRFHETGGATDLRDGRGVAFHRLLGSVVDACNAVAYAHSRGVLHRDLKPANIMLGPFGETLVVDWGIAKGRGDAPSRDDPAPADAPAWPPADASMTRPGAVVGTPRYMSPEQAAGDAERVGPASDVYGLGAILYCVLVGRSPFPDGDVTTVLDRVRRGIFPAPRRLVRSVDPALETICLKAMALDPADRHDSAVALAAAIEGWLADVRFRGEHEAAVDRAKGTEARLWLERALHAFGGEAHAEGMLWLARALEDAPPSPPELAQAIRMSLGGWHAGAKLLERSLRYTGEIHAVAFCPEGRRLATGGVGRTARLWDLSTGTPLTPPFDHDGPVRVVAFRPDGASVATAGGDGTIRLWDAVTGEPLGGPIRHGAPVTSLGFSPDGSRIAAAGGSGGDFLWDAATGRPVLGAGPTRAHAVAFAPDGSALAVGADDGVVVLDTATGEPLGGPLAHASAVRALEFDDAGRSLLTGCLDGEARVWDVAGRAVAVTVDVRGEVRRVAFRPGGGAFATVSEDGTARLWESATGRPLGGPLDHRSGVDCLAFSPDGATVATGGPDGMVRLWCAASGVPIGPPLAQGGAVRALAFSHDGRRLASGGSETMVRCWRTPAPVSGTAERIACWVRVTTDLEFDEAGAIRRMDPATSWELRRRLGDLGGPPLR